MVSSGSGGKKVKTADKTTTPAPTEKNYHTTLTREPLTQFLDRRRLLLLSNLLVLLLVGSSLEALPRQTTAEEVHEHVAESLEIVTTGLLPAEMGVDAHVSCGFLIDSI